MNGGSRRKSNCHIESIYNGILFIDNQREEALLDIKEQDIRRRVLLEGTLDGLTDNIL